MRTNKHQGFQKESLRMSKTCQKDPRWPLAGSKLLERQEESLRHQEKEPEQQLHEGPLKLLRGQHQPQEHQEEQQVSKGKLHLSQEERLEEPHQEGLQQVKQQQVDQHQNDPELKEQQL